VVDNQNITLPRPETSVTNSQQNLQATNLDNTSDQNENSIISPDHSVIEPDDSFVQEYIIVDDDININPSSTDHIIQQQSPEVELPSINPKKRIRPLNLRQSHKLHPPKRLRYDYCLDAIDVIYKYL
jgi:hypothetical protein